MERGIPASSPMPTREDYRRKVTAMTAGEPEALGALTTTSPFDLGLTDAPTQEVPGTAAPVPAAFTLSPREMLRGLVLGEVLDEPKGRRGKRRPHPK